MSPRDTSTLIDRMVAGERLSPDETRRVDEAARADPARAQELALLDELAGFVDARSEQLGAESIAIAHAALARVMTGAPPRTAVPHRSRRALVPAALVSLVAAAIAVLAWSWPRREADPVVAGPVADARISIAVGEVTLDGRAIGETPPHIADATTVAVRDGRACLTIEPRIDVCLDASTTASVKGLSEPQTVVEIHRGHAVARLDPLPAGRTFALGVAEVRVVAIGTIFSIDVGDGGSITAAVLEGVVEIVTADTIVRLEAHEVARLATGVVERGRLSASAESRDLELLAAVPDHDGPIGYVAIEVSPAGAAVFVDDRALGKSPLVAALGAGEHRLELRGSDGARLGETLSVGAGTLVTRRFALTGSDGSTDDRESPSVAPPTPDLIVVDDVDVELDADQPPRPRAAVPSPRALLAEARTLRREDRWNDAAAAYRRLLREHPRSSEAHTALVSLADLLLDRLDQPEQAARAYLRYVREGGGVLAPEARWGIIRARRKQSDARAVRAAIDDFVRQHPDDVRVESLR